MVGLIRWDSELVTDAVPSSCLLFSIYYTWISAMNIYFDEVSQSSVAGLTGKLKGNIKFQFEHH